MERNCLARPNLLRRSRTEPANRTGDAIEKGASKEECKSNQVRTKLNLQRYLAVEPND